MCFELYQINKLSIIRASSLLMLALVVQKKSKRQWRRTIEGSFVDKDGNEQIPQPVMREKRKSKRERMIISLNDKFEPVSDNAVLIGDFRMFLGQIAKDRVSVNDTDWRKVTQKDELWAYREIYTRTRQSMGIKIDM